MGFKLDLGLLRNEWRSHMSYDIPQAVILGNAMDFSYVLLRIAGYGSRMVKGIQFVKDNFQLIKWHQLQKVLNSI